MPTAKPSPAAGVTGSADKSINAGGHNVAANGSADAEHSKGSNSLAAQGNGSLN
jgi:hypothetical protein